jgi:hypothetical protein
MRHHSPHKIYTLVALVLIAIGLLPSLSANANDPTRPQTGHTPVKSVKQSSAKASAQPLTAIISKNNQAIAVIEGNFYRQGDYYRGSKVVQIDLDKVLLSSSSGNFQLTLIPKIKK